LKNLKFDAFITNPSHMWATPNITEIFIFREFINPRLFDAKYQFGSIPTGYTQSINIKLYFLLDQIQCKIYIFLMELTSCHYIKFLKI